MAWRPWSSVARAATDRPRGLGRKRHPAWTWGPTRTWGPARTWGGVWQSRKEARKGWWLGRPCGERRPARRHVPSQAATVNKAGGARARRPRLRPSREPGCWVSPREPQRALRGAGPGADSESSGAL